MNQLIRLENICKDFGDRRVLHNIDLSIKENSFLTLLGPSGCGKSTMLRLIAGFEQPTEGNIYLDGKIINDVPPHKRPLNTVFQRYALFDHLNIYDNIAFGLKINKVPKEEIDRRVKDMLHLVNLEGYERRWPDSLSGGQMQRVAMARALVNQPKILLLDEPLAALDLKMRQDMQLELKNMQKHLGITFMYVTHDQEEALAMSDTVVVMNNGFIQQKGSPVDIYNEPQNAFVADFIGESNIIPGTMVKDLLVNFSDREFVCVDSGFGENTPVDVVVRPEDIVMTSPEQGMLKGTVQSVVFYGMHYEMMVESSAKDGFTWLIQNINYADVGTEIGMNIGPDAIHIMHKSQNSPSL
jgi:spermidine/putrescine transport system ATP-binding protein